MANDPDKYCIDIVERIEQCRKDQSTKLDLSDLMIGCTTTEMPNLHDLDSVIELDLSKNYLNENDIKPSNLPPNLKVLNLSMNDLREATPDMFPKSLISLNVSGNKLSYFEGIKFPELIAFYGSKNSFKSIGFPKNLEILHISNCGLGNITSFPKNLKEFNGSHNEFKLKNNYGQIIFADFPETTERVSLAFNSEMTVLPYLPDKVTYLNISGCNISTINKLPSSLKTFIAEDADICNIYGIFPANLIKLNLANNKLSYIPSLPTKLEKLFLQGNQLSTLPEIPMSVVELDVSDNFLAKLPDGLAIRTGVVLKYENNSFNSTAGWKGKPFNGTGTKLGTVHTHTPTYSSHYGNNTATNYSRTYWGSGSWDNWNKNTTTTYTYSNTRATTENPYYIQHTKVKYV